MLIATLFADRIGERFAANVVGVKPFGLVVQLAGMGVSGTIPIAALPDGPYRVDPRSESMVGAGQSFVVGDPLPVALVSTDEALGSLERRPVGKTRG